MIEWRTFKLPPINLWVVSSNAKVVMERRTTTTLDLALSQGL